MTPGTRRSRSSARVSLLAPHPPRLAEPFTPDGAVAAGMLSTVVEPSELLDAARAVAASRRARPERPRRHQAPGPRRDATGAPGGDRDRLHGPPAARGRRALSEAAHPDLRDQVLQAAMAFIEEEGVEGFTTRRRRAVVHVDARCLRAVRRQGRPGPRGLLRGLPAAGRGPRGLRAGRGSAGRPRRSPPGLPALLPPEPGAGPGHVLPPVPGLRPGQGGAAAGRAVRERFVGLVQRAIDAGLIAGGVTDVAHVLLATAQGVAAVEVAGWLGTSRCRWTGAGRWRSRRSSTASDPRLRSVDERDELLRGEDAVALGEQLRGPLQSTPSSMTVPMRSGNQPGQKNRGPARSWR